VTGPRPQSGPAKAQRGPRQVTGKLDGRGLRIGIAVARFNEYVTRQMLEVTISRLAELGVTPDGISIVWVPGSFELPLAAKKLAQAPGTDAVITLGAVIHGETAHFEHIANAASQGIARVAEDTGKPVIFGVLTIYTAAQAVARIGHARGYAEAAVEMANAYRELGAT
jgi:6,7-dimethyl-8-ribityllumazine synthase